MISDFNVITSISESTRSGGRLSDRNQFSNWLNQLGLIDLGYPSSLFNWAKGVSNTTRIQRCLDKAVCNQDWKLGWPEALVRHLERVFSNHALILLNFNPHI